MNKTSEYHVASFIAHSLPRGKQALANEIKTIEGAEVHAISNEGKIVFTVEANDQRLIANRVDQIRYHDELLSLSPIYHQFLTEEQSY
jgi:periplasmic nitrate reductase NapD